MCACETSDWSTFEPMTAEFHKQTGLDQMTFLSPDHSFMFRSWWNRVATRSLDCCVAVRPLQSNLKNDLTVTLLLPPRAPLCSTLVLPRPLCLLLFDCRPDPLATNLYCVRPRAAAVDQHPSVREPLWFGRTPRDERATSCSASIEHHHSSLVPHATRGRTY